MRFRSSAARTDEADRLRGVIEALPHPVWTALPDGRIDWSSARWHVYAGAGMPAAPGDTRADAVLSGETSPGAAPASADAWIDRLHPADAARTLAAWQRSIACGEAGRASCRLLAHDGSHRWFDVSWQAQRAADGRIVRWCGCCTDIDDARQARRTGEDFVALVSHALRTPLTAILGWVQVLHKRPDDPATVRHVAEVVERNARTQAHMVDALLDASRLAAGSLTLEAAPLELRALARDAIEALAGRIGQRRIELIDAADAEAIGSPSALQGDTQRLRQVLDILLDNAVHATGEAGRITLRLQAGPHAAIVEIADDGAGIAPQALDALFDRPRQGGSPTDRRTGRLGLGLPIARGLVELHGGTIEAASDGPGRGALFRVRLPRMRTDAADGLVLTDQAAATGATASSDGAGASGASAIAPAAMLAADALAGLRVLVIDDEPDSRALAARVLGDAGAAVVQADGADEASMALGGGLRPDVVVSDLGMPRMDGYSLMRMLRELPGALREVPTVALSGLNLPEDRIRATQAGFSAFLSKPFQPAELVALVAHLTGRHPGD